KDGPDRMLEMLEWGMQVTFTDERAVFAPGPSIVSALYRQARRLGVETLDDAALLDLYLRDGRVVGALALDLKSGRFIRIQARAVILATGGWHKAFSVITGSRELAGDGTAMALRAGAELADMEFITFACNVVYWPNAYRGSIFPYVMGLLVGGELENVHGERIFPAYDPWMVQYANKTEWNKSFISLISTLEIQAGSALPHGGLRFTAGDMSFAAFDRLVDQFYKGWTFHDGDFTGLREKMQSGEGIEVGPGAEYFEGGIAVNERYETSLPGLYAAGECAGSVFGANRVAAATMEMLNTGARAGWSAADHALSTGSVEVDTAQEEQLLARVLAPLNRRDSVNVIEVRQVFQESSQQLMGPARTEQGLGQYLRMLDGFKRGELTRLGVTRSSPVYNKEWIEALDLFNMIDTMQVCARAALERTESRGVHYRRDYPVVDNDAWLKQNLFRQENGELILRQRPVNTCRITPPAGKTPYMAFIKRMMEAHSDVGGHH
ncbi:MAG: FAD-binding protein, partial [Anaerolineales bacterium]|nr:FAD-binding protein [Anaerolineales bacterium]